MIFCFQNCFDLMWEMVFCYQNCSDLLWEKIVLLIKKNFWNSRLKTKNVQKFWDHKIHLFEQWKVSTIFETQHFFNFFPTFSLKTCKCFVKLNIVRFPCLRSIIHIASKISQSINWLLWLLVQSENFVLAIATRLLSSIEEWSQPRPSHYDF